MQTQDDLVCCLGKGVISESVTEVFYLSCFWIHLGKYASPS